MVPYHQRYAAIPVALIPGLTVTGKEWIHLDPLSIFHVSAKIYRGLDSKLCHSSCHQQNCPCDSIELNFGKRPFKCGFLNCSFQQHGFESKAQRAQHENGHTRAWKCSFSGCEYEKIGFLSSSMRDQHLEKAHRGKASPGKLPESASGQNELQALVLDLVRDDEVDMVERLLPRVENDVGFYDRLGRVVGELGSVPMAQMIWNWQMIWNSKKKLNVVPFYGGAIKTVNVELLKWLISSGHTPRREDVVQWRRYTYRNYTSHIAAFLETDSQEMWRLCEQYVAAVLANEKDAQNRLTMSGLCLSEKVIHATGRIGKREEALLSLWESVVGNNKLKVDRLSSSLGIVAKTTCSIPLGRALLEYGANVDGQNHDHNVAPLQYAARKSSAANAEFMKFLLSEGADPEKLSRSRKPSDEIGAKEIHRWLGITWNELVEQTRNQRRSVNPQSSQ